MFLGREPFSETGPNTHDKDNGARKYIPKLPEISCKFTSTYKRTVYKLMPLSVGISMAF